MAFFMSLRLQLDKFAPLVQKLQATLGILKQAMKNDGETEVIHTLLCDSSKVVEDAMEKVNEGISLLKGNDAKNSKESNEMKEEPTHPKAKSPVKIEEQQS